MEEGEGVGVGVAVVVVVVEGVAVRVAQVLEPGGLPPGHGRHPDCNPTPDTGLKVLAGHRVKVEAPRSHHAPMGQGKQNRGLVAPAMVPYVPLAHGRQEAGEELPDTEL